MANLQISLGVNQTSIIGVGGAGNNIVETISRLKPEHLRFLMINNTPRTSNLGNNIKFLMLDDTASIESMIKNSKHIILIAGMGGNTGANGVIATAKIAKKKKVKVDAFVTMPLSIEGDARKDKAKQQIEELSKYAGTVVAISIENSEQFKKFKNRPFSDLIEQENLLVQKAIEQFYGKELTNWKD